MESRGGCSDPRTVRGAAWALAPHRTPPPAPDRLSTPPLAIGPSPSITCLAYHLLSDDVADPGLPPAPMAESVCQGPAPFPGLSPGYAPVQEGESLWCLG